MTSRGGFPHVKKMSSAREDVEQKLSACILDHPHKTVYELCRRLNIDNEWEQFLALSGGCSSSYDAAEIVSKAKGESNPSDFVIRWLGVHMVLTVHDTLSILQTMRHHPGLAVFPDNLSQHYPVNNACIATVNNSTVDNQYQQQTVNESLLTDNNEEGCVQPVRTCQDKIALLIGNGEYDEPNLKLDTPRFDVQALTQVLTTSLGFRVVSLINLRRDDMLKAIDAFNCMLGAGVYGLFFYSGHGFENGGMKYLIPTDIVTERALAEPQSCVPVSYILDMMQNKHTSLNVILLDMCRDRIFLEQGEKGYMVEKLDTRDNTVIGYATGSGGKSWEDHTQCQYSLYVNSLLKYIRSVDETGRRVPVRDVLQKTCQEVNQSAMNSGTGAPQHPVTESSEWRDCSLADERVYNIDVGHDVWEYAHKLPALPVDLSYSCGMKVRLGLAALYSNVMIIYLQLHTETTHQYITDARAYVVDHSIPDQVECCQKLINVPLANMRTYTEENAIYRLLDRALPNHQEAPCTENYTVTVLSNIERLQEELVFRVCGEWTHNNSGGRHTEVHQVKIPSPLVVRLWRHHQQQLPRDHVTEPTVSVLHLNIS